MIDIVPSYGFTVELDEQSQRVVLSQGDVQLAVVPADFVRFCNQVRRHRRTLVQGKLQLKWRHDVVRYMLFAENAPANRIQVSWDDFEIFVECLSQPPLQELLSRLQAIVDASSD